MNTNVFFLLVEYSGIPIGLVAYNTIIGQLASADPILATEKSDSNWHYGLELMQIVSVSTMLYGLSFLGHAHGNLLDKEVVGPLLLSLCVFMLEFFTILYITLKVRLWGKKSRQSKVCTNCIAFLFWIVLIVLIISQSDSNPATVSETLLPRKNNLLLPPGSRRSIFYYSIAGCLLIGGIILFLVQFRLQRTRKTIIKDYAKGAALINADPTKAIRNLQHSLQKIPSNSPLLIDMHMKLARIYSELGESAKALDQIAKLAQTQAYKEYEYLRTGVLCYQFDLLVSLGKLPEAEKLIDQIQDAPIAAKLKYQIYKLQRPAP
jgi:hypothetical protein